MTTEIIMCSSPLDRRLPDDSYQLEYEAAKKITKVHLIDIMSLDSYELSTHQPEGGVRAVYHGWMMPKEQYRKFFRACEAKGLNLVNTPAQYSGCHYFDQWYPRLEGMTPKSVIVPRASVREMMDAVIEFQQADHCAVIIKDYVKSLKHLWHEACFIPENANALQVAKVISTFVSIKERDNDFQGNLVVRKFEKLKNIGEHSKSKMPLTQEYRYFILDGKIAFHSKYWNEGDYDAELPPESFVLSVANRIVETINSKFFTIDVAQLENGNWTCIEVGDGQVSAIPERENPDEFFSALMGV